MSLAITSTPIRVQQSLHGVHYPAHKRELIAAARQNGADARALAALEKLPERRFVTPAEVSKQIGRRERHEAAQAAEPRHPQHHG